MGFLHVGSWHQGIVLHFFLNISAASSRALEAEAPCSACLQCPARQQLALPASQPFGGVPERALLPPAAFTNAKTCKGAHMAPSALHPTPLQALCSPHTPPARPGQPLFTQVGAWAGGNPFGLAPHALARVFSCQIGSSWPTPKAPPPLPSFWPGNGRHTLLEHGPHCPAPPNALLFQSAAHFSGPHVVGWPHQPN